MQSYILFHSITNMQSNNYLNTYFDMFIMSRINGLSIPLNVDAKNISLFNLLQAVNAYKDKNHQMMMDTDEEICDELEDIINDAGLLPVSVPQKGRRKLYYDLTRLKEVLEKVTEQLHSDEINFYVREMLNCTPHTAIHYELLLKNDNIKVYYNRLKRLAYRLSVLELDCDSEYETKTHILAAYAPIEIVGGEEPIEIPDDRDEFFIQWRASAFDNQLPETLYPPQSIYRNMPYNKMVVDDWIYAHRAQMKYMNGDVYWRKSPAYSQIGESIQFAFHNYPDIVNDVSAIDFPQLYPPREWRLDSVPIMPKSHVSPNNSFTAYYNEIVDDFCACVNESGLLRTDEHLPEIYRQASKIRVMSEWMLKGGIDNVNIRSFIMFGTLEPVAGVCIDLSNSPYVVYRKLIDYFAYTCYVDCDKKEKEKVINTIKMFNSIVN